MGKKGWSCIIVCLVVIPLFSTTKKAPLPGHLKPFRIRLADHCFYITEGPRIFIYSLENYKLVKSFGKAGEGPQEFKLPPEFSTKIDFNAEFLLVSSVGKVSFFSVNGEFIKEQRAQFMNLINMHRMLGNQIVGEKMVEDQGIRYIALYLYDAKLKKIREIHRHKFYLQRGQQFNPITRGLYLPNFYIRDGKIFVGGDINSGTIHVIDPNGKVVQVLKPPLPKVTFTKKDKQGWIDSYMSNAEYRRQYHRIKHRFKYPRFFPMFQNFIVADGLIYVQTFKRDKSDKNNQFVILDLQGELLKRVWLPLGEYWDFTPGPYDIKNNTLYQILENEDSEEWELNITKIAENK